MAKELLISTDLQRHAGFWVRFIAAVVDLVAFTPLYFGMQYIMKSAPSWLFEWSFGIIVIIIYAWFFSSRWQGSPGMYLLKFHISGVDGEKISFGKALFWGISSSIGWAVCLAGVIYLESRFDLRAVSDLTRSCLEQNIAIDDCKTEIEALIGIPYESYQLLVLSASGMALFLLLIWALSIGVPKDKTGFHNILCGTRFIKGRVI